MHTNSLFTLHRLTFGPKITWLKPESVMHEALVKHETCLSLLFDSIPDYSPIDPRENHDTPLFLKDEPELQRQRDIMPRETIIHAWLMQMREEDNAIREKAALFWHHHIPSTMRDTASGELLLDIYRKHAIGNLRELLKEIITNKSVLYFLTGIRSTRENPNENFARELLELYTLGDGNYTQADIIGIARAFTGMHPAKDGISYIIHPDLYDTEIKSIFGKKGNFDRLDVIDLILEQEQTARHISKEALAFYGNLSPHPSHIEACAKVYRESDYSFLHLLRFIFTSDWLYNTASYKKKVKTPIELFIGFQRQIGYKLIGNKAHKMVMSSLGQELFSPHSVAGWQEGRRWLQGKNILNRKFLLQALLEVANRPFERSSLEYKLYSRISRPDLRHFRYTVDGSFKEKELHHLLNSRNISLQTWMLGTTESQDEKAQAMNYILQSDAYQYI